MTIGRGVTLKIVEENYRISHLETTFEVIYPNTAILVPIEVRSLHNGISEYTTGSGLFYS